MFTKKFINSIDDVKFLICQYLSFEDINALRQHQKLSQRLMFQDKSYLFKFIFQRDFKNIDNGKNFYSEYLNVNTEVVNQRDNLNYLLGYAAMCGLLNLVKSLIDKKVNKKVDIHADDDLALRLAAIDGHLEVVKYLVQGNFSPETNERDAKYLISKNANIHALDDEALMNAACYYHFDVAQFLISKGANVHANNDKLLRWAVKYNKIKLVEFLIVNKADIHVNNNYPLKTAVRKGFFEIVKLLVDNIGKFEQV